MRKTSREMTLKEAVELVRDLNAELEALDIQWQLTHYLEEVISHYDDLVTCNGYAAIEMALQEMDKDLKETAARKMWLSIMKDEIEGNDNNHKKRKKQAL